MKGIFREPERIILHSDMNSFYASVECLHRPTIRNKPVAVGGSPESRHGIILAKNQLAKRFGVTTGEALWEARQKCPDLIVVPPNYPLYLKFSKLAREIYYEYTNLVEPFGLDEAWLDISESNQLRNKDVRSLVDELSHRINFELGLTVSIGISWNKIFAKFGSDYKKPNGITFITRANYQDLVWNAPVEDLLYVGPATKRKLKAFNITTIGELACTDDEVLSMRFGKIGKVLAQFARGEDSSEVRPFDPSVNDVLHEIKTVGNGLTAPQDLLYEDDCKALLFLLSESVAQRLREYKLVSSTTMIHVRDSNLHSYTHQMHLPYPTNITSEIMQASLRLLKEREPLDGSHPLRSLGVRAADLSLPDPYFQFDLFGIQARRDKLMQLDHTIDSLRARFGNGSIKRGAELLNDRLLDLDIKRDNIIHPVGFFS
ncbi:MAG: DNA polymerase IV [Coriobacteriia bacterium]|nr:DNA polymerase IV [Coriobacteriia bacterium]